MLYYKRRITPGTTAMAPVLPAKVLRVSDTTAPAPAWERDRPTPDSRPTGLL
jgi:hypothetical protein